MVVPVHYTAAAKKPACEENKSDSYRRGGAGVSSIRRHYTWVDNMSSCREITLYHFQLEASDQRSSNHKPPSPPIQRQNPSFHPPCSPSPVPRQRLAMEETYHLAMIYFASVNYDKAARIWLLKHDITMQGVNPKSSFAHHNPVKNVINNPCELMLAIFHFNKFL